MTRGRRPPCLGIAPPHPGDVPGRDDRRIDQGLELLLLPPYAHAAIGRVGQDGSDPGVHPAARVAMRVAAGIVLRRRPSSAAAQLILKILLRKLVPDPITAAVVVLIFEMYRDGFGLRAIAQHLTDQGRRCPVDRCDQLDLPPVGTGVVWLTVLCRTHSTPDAGVAAPDRCVTQPEFARRGASYPHQLSDRHGRLPALHQLPQLNDRTGTRRDRHATAVQTDRPPRGWMCCC